MAKNAPTLDACDSSARRRGRLPTLIVRKAETSSLREFVDGRVDVRTRDEQQHQNADRDRCSS
jgi:hypothetical protein